MFGHTFSFNWMRRCVYICCIQYILPGTQDASASVKFGQNPAKSNSHGWNRYWLLVFCWLESCWFLYSSQYLNSIFFKTIVLTWNKKNKFQVNFQVSSQYRVLTWNQQLCKEVWSTAGKNNNFLTIDYSSWWWCVLPPEVLTWWPGLALPWCWTPALSQRGRCKTEILCFSVQQLLEWESRVFMVGNW